MEEKGKEGKNYEKNYQQAKQKKKRVDVNATVHNKNIISHERLLRLRVTRESSLLL